MPDRFYCIPKIDREFISVSEALETSRRREQYRSKKGEPRALSLVPAQTRRIHQEVFRFLARLLLLFCQHRLLVSTTGKIRPIGLGSDNVETQHSSRQTTIVAPP